MYGYKTLYHYYYYLLCQLGTGGRSQKAQPIQGAYPLYSKIMCVAFLLLHVIKLCS